MSGAPTENDGMCWPGACLKIPTVLPLRWNTPRSLNRASGPPEGDGTYLNTILPRFRRARVAKRLSRGVEPRCGKAGGSRITICHPGRVTFYNGNTLADPF